MHDGCSSISCTNDHNIGLRGKVFSAAMGVDGPNLFPPIRGNTICYWEMFGTGTRKRHLKDVGCELYACIGGRSTELF
jgi:hypothetical protein